PAFAFRRVTPVRCRSRRHHILPRQVGARVHVPCLNHRRSRLRAVLRNRARWEHTATIDRGMKTVKAPGGVKLNRFLSAPRASERNCVGACALKYLLAHGVALIGGWTLSYCGVASGSKERSAMPPRRSAPVHATSIGLATGVGSARQRCIHSRPTRTAPDSS